MSIAWLLRKPKAFPAAAESLCYSTEGGFLHVSHKDDLYFRSEYSAFQPSLVTEDLRHTSWLAGTQPTVVIPPLRVTFQDAEESFLVKLL